MSRFTVAGLPLLVVHGSFRTLDEMDMEELDEFCVYFFLFIKENSPKLYGKISSTWWKNTKLKFPAAGTSIYSANKGIPRKEMEERTRNAIERAYVYYGAEKLLLISKKLAAGSPDDYVCLENEDNSTTIFERGSPGFQVITVPSSNLVYDLDERYRIKEENPAPTTDLSPKVSHRKLLNPANDRNSSNVLGEVIEISDDEIIFLSDDDDEDGKSDCIIVLDDDEEEEDFGAPNNKVDQNKFLEHFGLAPTKSTNKSPRRPRPLQDRQDVLRMGKWYRKARSRYSTSKMMYPITSLRRFAELRLIRKNFELSPTEQEELVEEKQKFFIAPPIRNLRTINMRRTGWLAKVLTRRLNVKLKRLSRAEILNATNPIIDLTLDD